MTVTQANISEVIDKLRIALKDIPEPAVTLVGKRWHDPFRVLIATLLSLRTRDETTLAAAERLFSAANTPRSLLSLPIKRIEKLIYPVGFYHTKAKRIHSICSSIINNFNGKVPDDIDKLMTLEGVGRKTANLVLTDGFGIPGICVDTHVHRISNRFGYVDTRNPLETEMALRQKLPVEHWIEYNSLLVMWGQNICKPVSPLCSKCALLKYCDRKGVTSSR
jgi:endonuclease-3